MHTPVLIYFSYIEVSYTKKGYNRYRVRTKILCQLSRSSYLSQIEFRYLVIKNLKSRVEEKKKSRKRLREGTGWVERLFGVTHNNGTDTGKQE